MTTKKSDKKNSKKVKKISSGSSVKEETEHHNEESAKAKKAKGKKPKFWKRKKKSTQAYVTPDEERIHKVEEISEETETKTETNKSVHHKKDNDKPAKVKRNKWKFLKRKKKDKKDNYRPDQGKEHADVPIFEETEKTNEIVVECTRSLPSYERNKTGHRNKKDDTNQDKKVKYSSDDEKKHANVEGVHEEVEKPRPTESTDRLLVNERDRGLKNQQEKPGAMGNFSVRSKRIAKKTRQKHQYKNCGPCFSCRSSE